MTIQAVQREVRMTYLGGSFGAWVSGALWAISAALGTWSSHTSAIIALAAGGALIFPIAQLLVRLSGHRATLSAENTMNQLAMQVAFTIPLCLPLIGAATLHRATWFYPAFLIVVGMHYLPFTFLYGMRLYTVLAILMVVEGLAIGLYVPGASFALGGWVGGLTLIAFGFALRAAVAREAGRPA